MPHVYVNELNYTYTILGSFLSAKYITKSSPMSLYESLKNEVSCEGVPLSLFVINLGICSLQVDLSINDKCIQLFILCLLFRYCYRINCNTCTFLPITCNLLVRDLLSCMARNTF